LRIGDEMSPTKEEIRQARIDAKLTQKQAGELLGYSAGAWMKWEYGERPMRRKLFQVFLKETTEL